MLPQSDDAIAQYMSDHGEPMNMQGSYRIVLTVETEEGLCDRAEAVVELDEIALERSGLTNLGATLQQLPSTGSAA